MVDASGSYTAAARGSLVVVKDDESGRCITFDRHKELMFIDYPGPDQYYAEVVAPVLPTLDSCGFTSRGDKTDLDRHHVCISMPKGATTNDDLKTIINWFVTAGVLGGDAELALHNTLANQEGRPPGASASFGK